MKYITDAGDIVQCNDHLKKYRNDIISCGIHQFRYYFIKTDRCVDLHESMLTEGIYEIGSNSAILTNESDIFSKSELEGEVNF